MEKIRRKLLVMALTCMLIAGMLPISAFAEGGTYSSDAEGQTELALDPVAPVEPDGNVAISGRLLDMDGNGISGQTIKIKAKPLGQGEDLTNEYLFPDVQTAEDGSFSVTGSWKVPDQFILADSDVTVSLDSESCVCEPRTARVSVVNPTLSVTGSIVWDDGDNIDGLRPEKTWLKIRRTDGGPVCDKDGNFVADLVEIAGTKGTKLSTTWEDLPTHDDIGGGRTQRVSYEVIETDQDGKVWTPAGYEELASGDMESGFVITNRHVHAHTLEKQARVEPSCSATGTEEHWKCTACGKLYSDENGENEIAKPVAIDALGHDWGEWVVTKEATEIEEGIETRTCGHDASHTETRSVSKLEPVNNSYRNTAGDGGEWTKGSKDALGFTFKRSDDDAATYDLFTGIEVDGKPVPEKDASGKANYTAKSGSVIIELQPSFLETLSVGRHSLTAQFKDGSATAEFTIKEKQGENTNHSTGMTPTKTAATSGKAVTTAPGTGDGSNALLWLCLMAVSIGMLLFVGNQRQS